jgi:hypothetical protein
VLTWTPRRAINRRRARDGTSPTDTEGFGTKAGDDKSW